MILIASKQTIWSKYRHWNNKVSK